MNVGDAAAIGLNRNDFRRFYDKSVHPWTEPPPWLDLVETRTEKHPHESAPSDGQC